MLKINPKKEKKEIISFIRKRLKKEGFKRLVLALSGGVDSVTAAFLAREAVGPVNLFVLLLPYEDQDISLAKKVIRKLKIPRKNVMEIDISKAVSAIVSSRKLSPIRKGNIIARVRMIYLFDTAKRLKALVCGTENRSEYLLGYYTRYGDEASDVEPIQHLYKTQVCQLAQYLGVSKKIIQEPPSAGLWLGQTDEEELGFSYKIADQILYQYFDKKKKVEGINARKVLKRVKENLFKHQVPYKIG